MKQELLTHVENETSGFVIETKKIQVKSQRRVECIRNGVTSFFNGNTCPPGWDPV